MSDNIVVDNTANTVVVSDTEITVTDIAVVVLVTADDDGLMSKADKVKLDAVQANATDDQTAAEILTAIKTVDGASSGLDADLLDGQEGSYYTGYADTVVNNLIDSAPDALNTLNELAAALGDDANFSATVTNSLAAKLPLSGGQMTGNITMSGSQTVDGRDISVDGAKLDGIEVGATADQTAAQIKTAYESNSDTNAFTDADHSKLDGIEAGATTDQTATEIRALVDSATDSNVFTDADHSKLDAIEASATADQTDAEIRAAVAAATDSNVFTDADHTKLDGIEANATADQTDAEIRTAVEAATDSNIFTDADHAKLNAIEASADVTDTTNVVAALTAGTNVSIANDGTISATDTNTTYTSSSFNHDDLTGFVANEHIDWTASGAGSIHLTNLPATALTTVQTASSQSAMLALTTQEGDVVVRSDENKTYMHNGGSAGNMSDFTVLATPTDAVTSVDGATGAITLNHDTLTGFVANEHIDWTTDQGATNLHAGNYTNTTYSVEDGGLTQNNFTNTLKTKLDGIETAATADQTAAEIRALVESATDSNIFTDADHTKLNAIEASATADQTASEIEAVVNHDNLQGFVANEHIDWTASGAGTIHSTNYTDTTYTAATTSAAGLMSAADKTKLNGVEADATADQTATEIRALVESATDSNVFTDADHSKLNAIEASATADQSASEIEAIVNHDNLQGFVAAEHVDWTTDQGSTNIHSGNYTNTTYSVGDGGLTQNNFTNTLKSKLDGIEASATADQSASEILTAVKTVDGASSGLDADLLDGQHGSYYTNYADTAVSNLVDSSPSALNTLNELAAALGDDANFSTTVTNSIATKMPLAGGTFTGDVTFSGASYNVVWDTSDNALEFADDAQLRFGAGTDLFIKSDGSNSIIQAAGANYIRGSEVIVGANGGSGGFETGIRVREISSETSNVELYYDNSKKFETSATGATVTGTLAATAVTGDGSGLTNVSASDSTKMPLSGGTFTGNATFADNAKARFGAGNDLEIYHDATDNHIDYSSKLTLTPSGGADLRFNGTSYDTDWMAVGHWHFKDNTQARFGNSDDLTITHNGSSNLVTSASASPLYLNSNYLYINNSNSSGQTLESANGVLKLKYASGTKLETTNTGVTVTGTLAATAVTGDGSGLTNISASDNTKMPLAGGTFTDDVTFTGASYNAVWDKSDNALEFADNAKAKFGTGGDLEIYHSGSDSFIKDVGDGALNLQSNAVDFFNADGSERTARFIGGGSNILFNAGAIKLQTNATGIDVTGVITDDGATHDGDVTFTGASYNAVWDKSDNALEFADNAKAKFGTGADLQIFHDSSNNHSRIVESGSGNLKIEASHFVVQNASNTESMIIAYENGPVELYNNNYKKVATTSTGINVTGNITVSGTVDGKDVSTLTTAAAAADEATALAIALG